MHERVGVRNKEHERRDLGLGKGDTTKERPELGLDQKC